MAATDGDSASVAEGAFALGSFRGCAAGFAPGVRAARAAPTFFAVGCAALATGVRVVRAVPSFFAAGCAPFAGRFPRAGGFLPRDEGGFSGVTGAATPGPCTMSMVAREATASPLLMLMTETPWVARPCTEMLSTRVRRTMPSREMTMSSWEALTVRAATTGPVPGVIL